MSKTYRIPDFIVRCPRKTVPINENFSKPEEEYNQWVDAFPLFGVQERTVSRYCVCTGCHVLWI